jgi:dimethylhistidine N-methyltransferase
MGPKIDFSTFTLLNKVSKLVPDSVLPHLFNVPPRVRLIATSMSDRKTTKLLGSDLVVDIRDGLTRTPQKELHSKYLYDDVGSALFEVITLLPEYGLTRAGQRLLERHTGDLIEQLDTDVIVVELGSGTGTKTPHVLSALARRAPTTYLPIDISATALARCRLELEQIEGVRVDPLEHQYLEGLARAVKQRDTKTQMLLLFLGSTIGNFERSVARKFLRSIHNLLRTNDVLYLATDLEKTVPQQIAAYDDSIGVTAAFNLNLLARINRELGADFDLGRFRHVAVYNETDRRIEMYLRSTMDQEVAIPGADLHIRFRRDETIWTESSHKFNCREVVRIAGESGFRCTAQWVDEEWPFAQSVLIAE